MSTNTDELAAALEAFVEGVINEREGFGFPSSAFNLDFLAEAVNDALYGADFIGALEELELVDRFVNDVRTALVIACRSTGISWDEIGEAMGRDRQWAWRTYREHADVTDDLNDLAQSEFEQAFPDFDKLGYRDDAPPEMQEAMRLLEREAERRTERVRRAIALTRDAGRKALVEREQAERRAQRPGRRPGPQGERG